MENKLRTAFLEKEKSEMYLRNLENLKEQKEVDDTQYEILKREYSQKRQLALWKINEIKSDIKKKLEVKTKELEVIKKSIKYAEIRYKVGEISNETLLKQTLTPRKKLDELDKVVTQLKTLLDANSSSEASIPMPEESTFAGFSFKFGKKQIRPAPPVETFAANDIDAVPETVTIEQVQETMISEVTPQEEIMELQAREPVIEPATTEPQIEVRTPLPPDLIISDLEILPDRVSTGNHVGIIAIIKNKGAEVINHRINLRVNDRICDSINITIAPNEAKELSFLIYAGSPGEYRVDLEGQMGIFTVYSPI